MISEILDKDIIRYENIFNDYNFLLSLINNNDDIAWKESVIDLNDDEKKIYYFNIDGNYNLDIDKKTRSIGISLIKPMRDYLARIQKDLSWFDDFTYEKIINIRNTESITIDDVLIEEINSFYIIYFFTNDDLKITFKNKNIDVVAKENSLIVFPLLEEFCFEITKYGNVDSYYATASFK